MNHMNVDVVELVGGKQEQGPMATRPKSRGRRNVFLSHYPEVDMPLLKRRYLTAVSVCVCVCSIILWCVGVLHFDSLIAHYFAT